MNSPTGRRGPLDYSVNARKRSHAQSNPQADRSASGVKGASRRVETGPAGSGRALTKYISTPVQKGIRGATRRSLHIMLEIFGGLVIVGVLVLALVYGRLREGPISLKFLVPPIERAVNAELDGLKFKIGGAVMRKAETGGGLEFRLKNVILTDQAGNHIAEAPFASVDLSLRALAGFSFAAEHVDLIGPKLFLQYSEKDGLALAFSKVDRGADAAAQDEPSEDASSGSYRQIQGARGGQSTSAAPKTALRNTVAASAAPEAPAPAARAQAINLTAALGGLFDQIRRSGSASYLTSFGMADADVIVGEPGAVNSGAITWRVRAASLELGHGTAQSRIQGAASFDSDTGPWQINFSAEQTPSRGMAITAAVNNIVPRSMATRLPSLEALKIWAMPLDLEGRFDIDADGALTSGSANAVLSAGQIFAPWDEKHPASIDEARLNFEYSRSDGSLKILPSVIRWGTSHIALKGAFHRNTDDDGSKRWTFDIGSEDTALAAEEFSLPAIPVDLIALQGSLSSEKGDIQIERLTVRAADAFVALRGSVQGFTDKISPAIRLEGAVSPMPIAFFKLIWPETIGHGARKWVGKHVKAGKITGGKVNVALPKGAIAALADTDANAKIPDDMINVKLGLSGVAVEYLTGMPPAVAPEATVSISGVRFLMDAPDAAINMPSGEIIKFTGAQFIVGDLRPDPQTAEVHFKAQGKAAGALELLDHEPLGYLKAVGLTPDMASGAVSGSFGITIPMIEDVKFEQLKLNGKAHHQDVRLNMTMGGYGIHGGSILFDLNEKSLEATGEVKVNGVPVKVAWQRIFDAPSDKQPPLRAAAIFDEAAREQLGLPINHVVRGPVPVETSVIFGPSGPPSAHVEANLASAELFLSLMGRRKPPGEKAALSFDVAMRPDGKVDLDNFKLTGDEIGVVGSISLNEQKKPSAFRFPHFSLNILTKLEVSGQLTDSNVWKIDARGASFDGREFFRSLFSAGKLSEDQPGAPRDAASVEMHAEIETVLGYFDTTLKTVTLDARKRGDKLTYLDMHGRLNGSSPMMTRVESKAGEPRFLTGEAMDAGAAFRLIGFYPAMKKGRASLRVNLDGHGSADKTGTLYVQNFSIVGDQVVGEVMAGTPKTVRSKAAARRAASDDEDYEPPSQDEIEFNTLKAPFSVGHGQFELRDAAINGPLLGATLRGKYDFARQYVDLSGTYVPLYGLNSGLAEFPVVGQLLTSRSGEGVFGITFAIQGSTNRPIQPQINPLSVVAPGFLRQIFEFDPPAPTRSAPQEKRSGGTSESRASSSPATTR
jgi:hypothetical protein